MSKTTKERIVVPLFKVLVNGESCHGGDGKYPSIGKWTARREPVLCKSGYHLTSDPLGWWLPRAELWLAEGRGAMSAGGGGGKAAFASARLVKKITPQWKLLPLFPRVRCFLAATARSLDPRADISWADLFEANLSTDPPIRKLFAKTSGSQGS